MTAIPASTLTRLFAEGEEQWQKFRARRGEAFHAFVPADWTEAARLLPRLRGHADSFLELGSGVGVITILASLCGFQAAGIEIEGSLVDAAEGLAAQVGADPQFAHGSYIPAAYQDTVDLQDTEIPTILDGPSGYDELGAELADFDLIYAFPWPGLEELHLELITRHGRRGALLLTFGGEEGFRLFRDGVEEPLPD